MERQVDFKLIRSHIEKLYIEKMKLEKDRK